MLGFIEVSGLWSKQQWVCVEDQPLSLEPFPVFHADYRRATGLPNCNALTLLKEDQARVRSGQESITKPGHSRGTFGQVPDFGHLVGRSRP
jgi:hypothetical protein